VPEPTWRLNPPGSYSCEVTLATWVAAIELSRATYRKMIQISFGRPLTTWSPFQLREVFSSAGGVDLPMSVGAAAMSASTIIVAANAQLLRRLNLAARDYWIAPSATGSASARRRFRNHVSIEGRFTKTGDDGRPSLH